MAEEGSRQVEVCGLDDKSEIPALLAALLSGQLLSPQLPYASKKVSPLPELSSGWDIYHSSTHWSTEGIMLHFVKEIIVPYVNATHECHGLDQKALASFDDFAAHRVASLEKFLTEAISCSSMSQPVVHQSCSSWTSLSMIPIGRTSNNAL